VVPVPVDSLTEDEEQRIRDIIFLIARPEEMATFDRLNAIGKRTFWHQFWAERDPSPGTPENEAKTEHLRRMNYAEERFSVGTQGLGMGWQTDMGRIYIVYGAPDLIERYPFTPERPPAQIWYYDHLTGQGQVLFLFLDEGGYGDYNLVHSSARGERRDPSWERQIQQGAFERTQ
jgi:GWxTD domain-containing protein